MEKGEAAFLGYHRLNLSGFQETPYRTGHHALNPFPFKIVQSRMLCEELPELPRRKPMGLAAQQIGFVRLKDRKGGANQPVKSLVVPAIAAPVPIKRGRPLP